MKTDGIGSPLDDLVDEISTYRKFNNLNWMTILRIALKHAPEETKAVLQKINTLDRNISNCLEQIAND